MDEQGLIEIVVGSQILQGICRQSAFTVDVTKVFNSWANGATEYGLAILPDLANVAPTDVWHVTFQGHKRAAVPHIKTVVTFNPAATPPEDEGVTDTPTPEPTEEIAPPVVLPDEGSAPVAEPGPVVAPTAQPVAFVKHFKYPMAFLFPIALLAAGVFLTRLFTRDATPVKRR